MNRLNEHNAREIIYEYIFKKYNLEPQYLFSDSPSIAVLKHEGTKGKWYGLIMPVSGKKLSVNLPKEDVLILTVKCDPLMIGALRMGEGYYQAYHMNKEHWLSILLDGTVDEEEIFGLIDISFELRQSPSARINGKPKNWIIPSNPKFYDIVKGFEKSDIHDWTQSSKMAVGDIVYMYVGVPYRAIMYKCEVLEVDLPRYWEPKSDKKAMKIKLIKSYSKDFLNKDVLLAYGIKNVRGPRYMPKDLLEKIEAEQSEIHN